MMRTATKPGSRAHPIGAWVSEFHQVARASFSFRYANGAAEPGHDRNFMTHQRRGAAPEGRRGFASVSAPGHHDQPAFRIQHDAFARG
jgi:hypothetical protein